MKKMKRAISITTAAALAASLLVGAPAAVADDAASSSNYVVSTRSFPKVNTAKTNFFAEATSTNVDADSNWGGLESMNVPQTKSTAEKEAEQKAKEEEEARKQAEAEAARQQAEAAAREQAEAAASRSQEREPVVEEAPAAQPETPSVPVPTSKNGQAIADFASKYVGAPYVAGGTTPAGWDCSGFVMWVFGQFGISLPRTSGAQATVGTAVPSLAQAQPGDIIANGMHAAIYVGNGMVVNALNPAQGTQITSLAVFSGGYSIRRVL